MNTQTAGSSCLPAMVEQCELRVLALQGTAYTPKHGKQKKKRGRKDREEKKEAKKAALKKEGSRASVVAKMTPPLRAALKCQNKMCVI